MKKNYQSLTEGPIVTALLTLGIPMVIANILQSAYQLTDALWVGRLGDSALAAVSVSFPITFLAISLATGFTVAGTTLVAQYVGAKQQKMVNHVASQTMMLVVTLSVLLSLVGFLLTPWILQAMGVAPDVYDHAIGFMRMSFAGLVFVFGFNAVQSLLRGIGEVKTPMYIVFATVVLNLFLDPLFIFGYGVVPAMGVMGAALATLVTQSVAMILGCMLLFGGKYPIHLKFKEFVPDLSFMKRAFNLGLPSSLEMSSRALGITAMAVLVAMFGTVNMAAYGVGSNILMMVIIPALGLAMATSTLVGQSIGAQTLDRAREVIRISSIIGFVVLSLLGVVVYLAAPIIAEVFVPGEEQVIQIATEYIRIMSWSFGAIGIQMSLIGVFRAAGLMKTAMALTMISQFVFQVPLAYGLALLTPMGIDGVWWTFPITNAVMLLVTVVWFMKGDWKKVNLTKDSRLQSDVAEDTMLEEGVKA